MEQSEILRLAALVAAFVGVIKGYGVKAKHSSVIAIGIAAILVMVPSAVRDTVVNIATIGLTASGAYSCVKTKNSGKDAS
ncbi:hypothetical protein M3194_24565 [Paenibacillus glycanilyticus]|uniref:hypothetical protein n=1 Tax=Paenibacillus glycanilyticus TaxID=126569 RepID=UPI00203FF2D2|nr:hypothetical protein [Paenibacillus glycanilyticus]MCM3630509.1 hypothetical protein [Paenibacillus glycanilyticus]